MPMGGAEKSHAPEDNSPDTEHDIETQVSPTVAAETLREGEASQEADEARKNRISDLIDSGVREEQASSDEGLEVARTKGLEPTGENTAPTTESVLEEKPKNPSAWKRFWTSLTGGEKKGEDNHDQAA